MTSKLTREQAQQIIDAADAVISALAGTNDEVHKDDTDKMVSLWDDLNDRYAPPEVVRELARMALAAMDSEPVAYTDERNLGYIDRGRETAYLWGKQNTEVGDIALYRHAQRAPVVTFYRDGIEAAAKWIDKQREAYDSEHGWSDPDTGAFEFGNDAQRGYSSTLEELAEGIRALHPNAGNSPVITDRWIPVSEKLPERGDYLVSDGRDFDVQLFNGEQFIPGFVWEDKITHWMPLPATPQEVK